MVGRAFADVLDDVLNAAVPPPVWARPAEVFTLPPRDPFLFFRLSDSGHARPANRAPARPVSPPAPVEIRRPARALTPAQQQALDALNAFGTRLSPDFTAQELRREYCRLAHRIHPDRHQRRSDAERRRLSHQFGEATGHYRRLLLVVDPRH
ncbi:MAG TPA: hypothetical protein PLH72_00715 [Vicinamibacterales bacterium]|nr:hypothetical protein [Vicinamibacterales bacterium]